jgi:hypothetical protein
VFAILDTDSGLGLVIIGLLLAGFGQGFAYNLSNTAGMETMPDEKTGVASGVLQTARLMGIVIGLALSGAVFRILENNELTSKLASEGRGLTAGDEETIRGLLSGSDAARQQLAQLTASTRDVVDDIVDAAFVLGQRGVMILGVIVCALGAWTALWGRRRAPSEARTHRIAHGFSPAHWRHPAGTPVQERHPRPA